MSYKPKPTKKEVRANLELYTIKNPAGMSALSKMIDELDLYILSEKSNEFYDKKEVNQIINNQLNLNQMAKIAKPTAKPAEQKPAKNYEQKDNNGTLFVNADKSDSNPNWPDYKGKIMVDGVMYYASAWIKTPQSGDDDFLSLSVKPIE